MGDTTWYQESHIYWCAFCNREIDHEGFDPVTVYAEASRTPNDAGEGAWSFHAHALCIRNAFDPGYRREIPPEVYMPRGGSERPE